MSQPTIQYLKPTELTPHPALRLIPEWETEDPRFLALVDNIRDRGIDQPLLVDSSNRILDGRHRWRAAKRLQLDVVPVIRRDEGDALEIAVDSMEHRRHYTQSQRAYALFPLMEPAFKAAQERRYANLKNHRSESPRTPCVSTCKTPEDWAKSKGISLRYLQYAKELHEHFKDKTARWIKDPFGTKLSKRKVTFQEHYEPQIMSDEKSIGLGSAISGIESALAQEEREKKGIPHKGGRPADKQRQVELLQQAFTTLETRFEYWAKFDEEDKKEAMAPLKDTLTKMPTDMLSDWSNAVRAEQRRRTKESDSE